MKTIRYFFFKSFKFSLFLLLQILLVNEALAASTNTNRPSGAVVKYQGDVVLFEKTSDQPSQLRNKRHWLFEDNRLQSKEASKAYVKLRDGSRLLMRNESSVHIVDGRQIQVLDGKVLFAVAKRQPKQKPFRVATRVAMLGIRGTRFLVESGENDDQFNVYLKDGDISVYPIEKQFKLFKEGQKQAFDEFVAKSRAEFAEYKKQHMEEFFEYVKEYQMKPNKGIAINGNELSEVDMPPEVDALFSELDDPAYDTEIPDGELASN